MIVERVGYVYTSPLAEGFVEYKINNHLFSDLFPNVRNDWIKTNHLFVKEDCIILEHRLSPLQEQLELVNAPHAQSGPSWFPLSEAKNTYYDAVECFFDRKNGKFCRDKVWCDSISRKIVENGKIVE